MRHVISVVIIICLLCSCAFGEEERYVCDVNDDTLMNIRDAVIVSRHANGIATLDSEAQVIADVTLNGIVDSEDVLDILEALAGSKILPPSIDRTVDGITFYVSHGSSKLTGAPANATDVVVKQMDLHTITSIGEGAFENHTKLTSITLPDTITVIGKRAFAGCTSLKEMKAGD